MDRGDILAKLANRDTYPADAIRYCFDHPDRTVAIYLPILGKAANGGSLEPDEDKSFYLGLHLLAALKITDGFAPLKELAVTRPAFLVQLLGEVGLGETFPRILMSLGGGKAAELWRVVETHELDFMIRDAFLRAWTFEVLEHRVTAIAAIRTLREYLDADDAPGSADPIWSGWLIAIADLGYRELAPLAERAIASGRILTEDGDRSAREISAFQSALAEAGQSNSLPAWLTDRGYQPFGAGTSDWGDCFLNAPQPPLLP